VIIDLRAADGANARRAADVVVVGGGIAGLILAARLRSRKMQVVVLESGGHEQTTTVHPLNRAVQLGDPYAGATHGRFRCLGGTSTRWGGALIPFMEHDLTPRPWLGLSGFPVKLEEVRPYLKEIEILFRVDDGSYDEEFVQQVSAAGLIPTGDADFVTRFAKWPSFRHRNVAVLLRPLLEQDPDLEIWINATATRFGVSRDSGRVTSVTASAGGDRLLTVCAKHAVICAGAIESTRILSLIDRQCDHHPFDGCTALGKYFNDHVSIPVARIRPKQLTKLNRMAGFRFVGSGMRSPRFELSAAAQRRERVGGAFAHISFRTDETTGFDCLRDFLRSLQRRGRIEPALLGKSLGDLPYLARMAVWRLLYNQLLWPIPAHYELHVVAEQLPRAENCIGLAAERDCFELPLAAIRWRVTDEDMRTFAVVRRCFDAFWSRHGLWSVGELEWTYDPAGHLFEYVAQADVYHPGGSTRMGTDKRGAVVDPNLACFAIPNLSVASTSVFPSGGGENPTLMLMLFTLRLADRLSRTLARA
jgi:choline dehydrogenase-like flavoprotein